MPSAVPFVGAVPNLTSFLKATKTNTIESSIDLLVSLLQRRQIRNSRQCALATAQLLLRVIAAERVRELQPLLERVRSVGRRLTAAQPREMAVGNIVRRVLDIIRDIAEEESAEPESVVASPSSHAVPRPTLDSTISSFSPLQALPASFQTRITAGESSNESSPLAQSFSDLSVVDSYQRPSLAAAHAGSLFGIFQPGSTRGTPPLTGTTTPLPTTPTQSKFNLNTSTNESFDLKAEVLSAIRELLDELDVVDSQIAESALDHIHSGEVVLTHTSSQTVQRFLAAAARKRRFTVIVAETWPNDHMATHNTIVNGANAADGLTGEPDEPFKPLTALGTTVILIPDSAVFAVMSRVNKVILAPHAVLANGSLLAASGSSTIALAARAHQVPVVVLSGVYKLSPIYPTDTDELIEWGDPSKVVEYADRELVNSLTVSNPTFDHISADLIDLYITNLGAHAPSYLYRIVADHYKAEDVDLTGKA